MLNTNHSLTINNTKMQKEFTEQFMQSNRGCYEREQMQTTVLKGRKIITLSEFLECDIPVKDKYWFVCKKLATKEQNQQIAIGVAEIVIDLYEKKYPENKAPREAIQAAKDYLNGTISIGELTQKRNAAADAAYAAAADAAYAAYAADAAYAAYAAAAAYAAYAADAAYAAAADAANADAAYAAAYDVKVKLLSFLKEFVNN